ncbi:hypothetical protein LM594_02630 [Candidatus Caldipriscus sp.]|nr:hypothetical protein [Candidatus Caldipriscus sp.]
MKLLHNLAKLGGIINVNAKFTDFGIKPPSLGVFIKRAPDELELSGEITFRIERKEG